MGKKKESSNEIVPLDETEWCQKAIKDIALNSLNPQMAETIARYIITGDLKTSAIKAGYSPSYTTNFIGKKVKKALEHPERKDRQIKSWSHTIREITGRMAQNYKDLCKWRLPVIAEIEAKSLEHYRENPALAIDKPQLLKQLKQGAGVLADDNPSPQFIRVGQIQVMMNEIHERIVDDVGPLPRNPVELLEDATEDAGGEKEE